MKCCPICRHPLEDSAEACPRCPAPKARFGAELQPAQPSPEFLTVEREGYQAVLKCRNPWEAGLMAGELAAEDILVLEPDPEALEQEYLEKGYVTLRVSARQYEAATQLHTIVERKYLGARQTEPLDWPMKLLALSCGIIIFPGFLVYQGLKDNYKLRYYHRKQRSLRRWYWAGVVSLVGTFFILVCAYSH